MTEGEMRLAIAITATLIGHSAYAQSTMDADLVTRMCRENVFSYSKFVGAGPYGVRGQVASVQMQAMRNGGHVPTIWFKQTDGSGGWGAEAFLAGTNQDALASVRAGATVEVNCAATSCDNGIPKFTRCALR
jgi:hypothetical protein